MSSGMFKWPNSPEWSGNSAWISCYAKRAAAVLSVTLAAIYGVNTYIKRQTRRKIEKKRKECEKSRQTLLEHLRVLKRNYPWEDGITELSFTELKQKLRDGRLRPVDVLHAFQEKALDVNQRLNCIVEPIVEAEKWAEELATRIPRGPLYGIPVSIKESTPVQGYDNMLGGCVNLVGRPLLDDCSIVMELKKQGAIPFVLTNAPQVLLSFACSNPIIGSTTNPHNPGRIPGGSSGGEAALIGDGGSLLGIGSDLGGSIRIPAAFCGICGLKPTVERMSYLGFFPMAQNAVCPSSGPMGREVESLVSFMRAVLVPDLCVMDPVTPPIPFRDEIYEDNKPLRIGYYHDDGYYPAIPACHRAVNMAKATLEKQGHILIKIEMPDVKHAMEKIGLPAIFGDGGSMISAILFGDEISGDKVIPVWILRLPRLIRRLVAWFDKFWDPQRAELIRASEGKTSVSEWWMLVASLQQYRTRVLQDWQRLGVDAVICPSAACVAVPYGIVTRLGGFYSYTFIYNILNFPAGVVPVTRVNSDDTANMKNYKGDTDGRRTLKKAMVGSEGLPVGIQCVGLPFQEELVLRLMKNLQDGLQT